MPELPEVEVVRRGLHRLVRGGRITAVDVHHPRAVRRHSAGRDDFIDRLLGAEIQDVRRRGKFLWLPLNAGYALLAHLGMSGQFRVLSTGELTDRRHLRVSISLDRGRQLLFLDQRTFGGLWAQPVVAGQLPESIGHIAPDPLDASFDAAAFALALRSRRTQIKRALLDQSLISGVGNIYADEALWRARLHYLRQTRSITPVETEALLTALRQVFTAAMAAGGTSFDTLYVNVNGASGYFDRSLHAYGQAGKACAQCGATIVREAFMNRSSYFCPRCQVLASTAGSSFDVVPNSCVQ